MNAPEIDKIFEKLRKAGHGSIIKFDASNSGQPVEGIIFEPSPKRPPGYESGVFVMVPSEKNRVYYLDPDASKEQGRLIIQVIGPKAEQSAEQPSPEELLKDFEDVWKASHVKRGGGATGEAYSKHKGIIEVK
ncbi:MAG: hypothetical protein C4532_11000 [Candidatus Abyssobacteria bacterium SURF_17]|uniref:Uncharacterized protein n=1 Tax=Candidatus Abyssobacteria bacterium SURF_17 TaxID=2093361 RepID=A0A419EXF7_9BACT|nr:MAG: hypothetical protein C4532_11000 [Candidatus Abyssubacteria bacterium SURF_17]